MESGNNEKHSAGASFYFLVIQKVSGTYIFQVFDKIFQTSKIAFIDVGTAGYWGHVPPRFCNKQRSALFIFRKCPIFLKEKSALEVSCPQF